MLEYFIYCYGGQIMELLLTAIFGCIAWAFAQFMTDERKRAIVKSAVLFVEQVGKGIHGKEKFKMALERIEEQLKKKHIRFDADEVMLLIEAEVAKLNQAIDKAMKEPLAAEDTAEAVYRVEK